jgi:hypothetical protein
MMFVHVMGYSKPDVDELSNLCTWKDKYDNAIANLLKGHQR